MMQPLNSFQRKNRQKARNRLLLQLTFLLAVGAVFMFAYQFGERQMAARVNQRMDEVQALTGERDNLHQQVVDLQAAAVVDQQKISELEARYREQIPDDTIAALIKLMRERITAGVSTDRMSSILAAASNPRSCRGRDNKRFLLSTSLNQGRDNSATFGAGAVTVSGEGKTFTNAEGKPEAWYDPDKPVSMKFRLIGGRVSVAEGNLPLQHSIIDDAIEYRFTIEAGPRGFVSVTGDQCDYAPNILPEPVEAPAATR